jgi:hypothetical protein
MTAGAPAAVPVAFGGARLTWTDLPAHVRGYVEATTRSTVVHERSAASGFSPGLASVLTTADGDRVFVKAAFAPDEPVSARLHRAEAGVVRQLPAELGVPRLRWSIDDGEWVVVAYDAVDGRPPATPWEPDELAEALDAVALIGAVDARTLDLRPAEEDLAGDFDGWSRLRTVPDPALGLVAPWAVGRLDELVELEARGLAASAGSALVHSDLRADNMLVTSGGRRAQGIVLVDWASAARGAPWLDVATFLPSVGMQGVRGRTGPLVDASTPAHRRTVGEFLHSRFRSSPHARDASADDERAFLAGLAGYFLVRGRREPVASIPNLRPFQRAQGAAAAAWLETISRASPPTRSSRP